MSERANDILCGAVSAVLASAAWTVGVYAWTAEAHLLRQAYARAGVVIRPMEKTATPVESPPPVAAPAPGPSTAPARAIPSDLAIRQTAFGEWHAEMVRMEVPAAEIEWLAAQCWTESRWRPHARSPVGAEGICQFMPRTRAEVAGQVEPSCEDAPSTDSACQARMQRSYNSDIDRWLPRDGRTRTNRLYSYNTGIGRVRKAIAGCRAQPHCDPRSDRQMARRVSQEPRDYRKRIFSVRGDINRQGFGATFGFAWD